MSKQSKNDSSEFINKILKNESSVDLDKVEYWTGNNKRSDFEEYRRLKDAENHLEMTSGLGNADGLTDVLATTLEFNNKEKGNDVFFDQMCQTIPKHDYLDKYPSVNDIKMEQKDISDDMDNDVKEEIYGDFKENTSGIISTDEEEIYGDFKENTSDITSTDEEEIYGNFKENTSDIISTDEEEIYGDFKENTSDITGQTDTKEDLDKLNYDLKP